MKRALLIGIDDYDSVSPLGGCVNDVDAVEPLLSRNEDGTPDFDCQRRTSAIERVTRAALLTSIQTLLSPGADIALMYFAGHGASHPDDVSLCTADGTEQTPGVALSQILGIVQNSPIGEVIILIDCCFSGAAGGVPQLGSASAVVKEDVSILAASRGDQPAAETPQGRGAFSTFLCGALDGGAADVLGKVTLAGIYAYLSESFGSWDQRPTFKANVDRLHELRLCKPAVPLPELRRLTEFFPDSNHAFPLDPSFEDTEEPRNSVNEGVFKILQRCRAAKLVEPVGTEHMYYAAVKSKSCRLTPLGKHYWRMSHQGRV